jgi:hypothetical protein
MADPTRAYRIEQYLELRFTEKEASTLADAKMSGGRPLDWHLVKRAVNNGLSHKKVVDLLT